MPRPPERFHRQPTIRPSQDLIAEWNAKLKANDSTLMTEEEEGQGIQFGAAEADGVEFVEQDESSQRVAEIAQAIAREAGNELWLVPTSLAELKRLVLKQIVDCRRAKQGVPKIGIHASCVTGDPCVFLQLPDRHPRAGIVLHLPTVDIEQFVADEFAEEISRTANIDVRRRI